MSDYPNGNSSGPQSNASKGKRPPVVLTPVWLTDLIPQRVIVGKERSGRLRYLCADHMGTWTALRRHWNPDRQVVWPSIETISAETGYSATKVKMLLRELEEVGAIRHLSRGRKAGQGGRSSNRYQLAPMEGPLPLFIEDETASSDTETASSNIPPEGVRDAERLQLGGLGTLSDHELGSQIPEQGPSSQNPKASDIENDAAACENPRETISDPETVEAIHALYNAIDSLSEDMEAATTWMVVQRVVDTLTQHGCHALALADGLASVTETLETKADGLWWGRGRQLGSPVGFVMWVAEVAGMTGSWEEVCSSSYWREAESLTGVNLTGTAA